VHAGVTSRETLWHGCAITSGSVGPGARAADPVRLSRATKCVSQAVEERPAEECEHR
jgi:hypothetical protein